MKVAATGAAGALGSSLTLSSTGMFVAPANQDCTVTAALGKLSLDQQLVVVGKKTFVDSGSGLEPAKASDFDFAEFCPSNPDFWKGFAVKPPKGIEPTKETKNGIAIAALRRGQRHRPRCRGSVPLRRPAGRRHRRPTLQLVVRGARADTWWRVQLQLNSASSASCVSLTDASPVPLQAPCTVDVSVRPVTSERQDAQDHVRRSRARRSSYRACQTWCSGHEYVVRPPTVRRSSGAPSRAVRARLALRREVAGVRATALAEDRSVSRMARCSRLRLVVGERVGGSGRVDAGPPQRLVAQQVAEAGDARLVHDHGLDRRPAARRRRARSCARVSVERVGAEAVLVGIELHRAEPARVAQEHACRRRRR